MRECYIELFIAKINVSFTVSPLHSTRRYIFRLVAAVAAAFEPVELLDDFLFVISLGGDIDVWGRERCLLSFKHVFDFREVFVY